MLTRSALVTFVLQKQALGATRDDIVSSVTEYGGDAALVDEVLSEQQFNLTKAVQEEDLVRQYLLSKQSLLNAMLAGGATAVLSALIWAGIAFATDYQVGWVAVILGCLVARSVRHFGRGFDVRFQTIGLVASLGGIFLGNAMIMVLVLHRMLEVPLGEAIGLLGDSRLYSSILEMTTLLDVIFYLAAAVCGWFLSCIPMSSAAMVEYTRLMEAERRS
jgi:hypothetical protein